MGYGSPWVCVCGVENWQSRQVCYGCGGGKPGGHTAGAKGRDPAGKGGRAGKGPKGGGATGASAPAPWNRGTPQQPSRNSKVLGDFWPGGWDVRKRLARRERVSQRADTKGAGKGTPQGPGDKPSSADESSVSGTVEGEQATREADLGVSSKYTPHLPVPRIRYTDQAEWEYALEHWKAREEACKASPTLALEGKDAATKVALLQGPLKPTPESIRSKGIAALQSCNAREIYLKEKIEAADKDIAEAKKLLRQHEEKKEVAQEALDGVRKEQAELAKAIEVLGPSEEVLCEDKTVEQIESEWNDKLAQVERDYHAASEMVRSVLAAKAAEEEAAKVQPSVDEVNGEGGGKSQPGNAGSEESEPKAGEGRAASRRVAHRKSGGGFDTSGKAGLDGANLSGDTDDEDLFQDRSRSPVRKGKAGNP